MEFDVKKATMEVMDEVFKRCKTPEQAEAILCGVLVTLAVTKLGARKVLTKIDEHEWMVVIAPLAWMKKDVEA